MHVMINVSDIIKKNHFWFFSSTACGERSLPRLIIVVQFVKKTLIHCEPRIPDAVSITIKEALNVIDPIGEWKVSYSLWLVCAKRFRKHILYFTEVFLKLLKWHIRRILIKIHLSNRTDKKYKKKKNREF